MPANPSEPEPEPQAEYEKFRVIKASKPSPVEKAFDETVAKTKLLQQGTPKTKPKKK